MGYASYVGRVGALAVALGVGAAIATTNPAISSAAPMDSGSSTSGPSADASSPADSPSSPVSGSASAAADSRSSGSGNPGRSGSANALAASAGSLSQSVRDSVSRVMVRSSGGAHTATTDVRSPRWLSSTVNSAVRPVTNRTTRTMAAADPAAAQGVSVAAAQPTPPARMIVPTAAPEAATRALSTVNTEVRVAAAPATHGLVGADPVVEPSVPPAAPVATRAPVSAPADVADTVVRLASSLVAAASGPLPPPGPQAPASPSAVLLVVLAGMRNEIEQTLLKETTVAGAQQVSALTVDRSGSAADTADIVQSPNLLVNPGAEVGDPSLSGYSSVTMPGWTVTGTPTVIKYGTLRRLPFPFAPLPALPAFLGFPGSASESPGGGVQFFGGGPVANSTLTQTVDLSGAASQIDTGTVPYTLSGDLGGFTLDPSAASFTVDFLDSNQQKLGTGQIKPVTVFDRGLQTGLLPRETSGMVPVGTRSAQVVLTFTDRNPILGNYNNAYSDNLSLTVGAALPAPPSPTPAVSTVGALDHVFLVYMENKGVTDIVGSPNAPYLNSLINAYGFASNYYALTHPSDPNYYPILGGSDFGVNYNCPANCFNQRNLADNIEAADKTWAGYAEGGGGYTAPTDRLPFLAFSDIYNDPARVEAHLFDLTRLETDLASASTTPNFVWFAADDATNMEGPTSGLGLVPWALSQLGDHQYNVKAGDQWLQDTLPIILNSPVWQDPTQKSAIFLTFDEDYNNLSLGIGNQGNHVVMVVIPSPGAVASGMRGGVFVADDHNNHYSLLRTIEDSLGLPPLTNNDKYAEPMNEFWT